ncbi:carboxypeptidase-like regulatory domain-containing protein [Lewinella sp. W8]|uniref:carboxypeptidase-like regulatory domain-containing protein n=1 Tax=Lewinella sp. W8 TaxID=2528208 RepID=UPI001068B327|nr:carboxypeptidase-like regulatory domain-containing protein [Lewinella sp. W8]MTB49761.1 hypothetical protein [Lewinella sp. W8]
MKPISLLLFCCFALSSSLFSQTRSAVVIDAEDGTPITFAAVAIKGRLEGQYTDMLGRFKFYDVAQVEELLFSALGYEDRKIRAGDLPDTVKLTPSSLELPTIELQRSGRMTRRASGSLNAPGTWGFSAPKGFTIVRYLPGNRRPGWLRSVMAKLNNNQACGGLFRLRLFSVVEKEKERAPGGSLLQRTIEVYVPAGQKMLEVNLREEDIFLPRSGAFIGLEFLQPDASCPTDEQDIQKSPNLALGVEGNRTTTYLRYPGDEWGYWHSYFDEEEWEAYFPRGVKTLHLQIRAELGYFRQP